MDQTSSFAEDLRRRRRAAGLTQEALAELSGLSPRAITDLERGIVRTPRLGTLDLLANALEMDSDERTRWKRIIRRQSVGSSSQGAKSGRTASSLPTVPNELIGRDEDVGALVGLLEEPACLLVTVAGPGGVGKTRVAIEAARRLTGSFQDGIHFIDLTSLQDPASVLPLVADRLGLHEIGPEDAQERLATLCVRREMLIVLDNFEHLLPAATGVSGILPTGSRSTVLVTSRAPLHIQAEHVFSLAPLALPETNSRDATEVIMTFPGIRLFVERARQVHADFALDAENAADVLAICSRLDGLPLAIELAAARTQLLTPRELRTRLIHRLHLLARKSRDGPDRHRTMRDAIVWSYELLEPEERRLFRQLSTFVGGWTVDAAEATNPASLDVLEGLATLLDNNLIHRMDESGGLARFNMLETIRQFGLGILEDSGELDSARASHARYCLDLAEQSGPLLRGPDPRQRLELIDAEMPNFRAASNWATHRQVDADFGLRLAAALSWYWMRLRGDMGEGRRWLTRELSRFPEPTAARMRALSGLSWVAHMQQDIRASRDAAQESLTIARAIGDDWYSAWSLHLLGRAAYFDDDPEGAYACGQRTLQLAEDIGDPWLVAWAYQLLGLSRMIANEFEPAREYFETSLAIWDDNGDRPGRAALLALLGAVASREGNDRDALNLFQQSLVAYRELGARWFVANFIVEVIGLAARLGEPHRAVRLSGFVDEQWELTGAGPAPFAATTYRDGLEISRQALSEEDFDSVRNAGMRLSLDEAVDEALRVGN